MEYNYSVNILIPTFNRAEYVQMAIKTALYQDYQNISIIVSDDASTDNTKNAIEPYLKTGRLKYYSNKSNLGSSRNVYKLIHEYSDSEWFILAADDDFLVDNTYISKAISLIKKYKDIVLVHANMYWLFENKGGYLLLDKKECPEVSDGKWYFLNWFGTAPKCFLSPTVLCRTDIAKRLDCFCGDEYSDDWRCWLRVCLYGKIGYVDSNFSVFRVHGSNYGENTDVDLNIRAVKYVEEAYKYAKYRNIFPDLLLDNWYKRNITYHFKNKYNNILNYDKLKAKMFAQKFIMKYPFIYHLE